MHYPSLDADLRVPQLVLRVFGSKAWMNELSKEGEKLRSQAQT